ncbi:MAG: substrate-binding domain-containing protein [Verrucomicrobiota bacterium]
MCLQDLESFNLTAKISSLQGRLRAKGYRVLLEFSDGAPEAEAEILNHFATMQVEGVVILAGLLARRSPAQRALDRLGIPIVPIDPREPSPRGTVWLDRGAALQAAARHLLQLGHRRFAALGIDPASYYGGVRTRALDEALSPPLAPARTSLRYFHEPDAARMDYAYGWRLAERLLAEAKRPTALIALSDTIAFGAMECLRRKHFRVPGDFSHRGLR